MSICKQIFLNCIEEFITSHNQSLSCRIFNYTYISIMIITISAGVFSFIDGTYFNSWGGIIFTIGCLMLMLLITFILIYCMSEFAYIIDQNINSNPIVTINKLNHSINGSKKLNKKKILTSERINVVIK
jgi:hypothetical protein